MAKGMILVAIAMVLLWYAIFGNPIKKTKRGKCDG